MRLPTEERDVLAALPGQLRDALDAGEPTLHRLFPPAFVDDDAANAEYARLVGATLLEGKLRALAELERTAHEEYAHRGGARTWLGGLESLRLVLGTQLDVTEESYGPLDPADPDAPRLALYHWLSWLQEEVVQALSDSLGDGKARCPTSRHPSGDLLAPTAGRARARPRRARLAWTASSTRSSGNDGPSEDARSSRPARTCSSIAGSATAGSSEP